jgi:hypothetical protein
MSTLAQDDADKEIRRALPWANDHGREEETKRLQEAVIEAAQRLGSEPAGPSPESRVEIVRRPVSLRLAVAPSSRESGQDASQDNKPQNDLQNDLEEMNRRVWAALMPKFIAPPPRDPIGLPGLALTAGVVSAVAVAAAVALVVVNIVQVPTIGAGTSSEDQIRSIPSSSTAALGSLTKVATAEAKTPDVDSSPVPAGTLSSPVPAGTLLAAAPTNDIVAPKAPAPAIQPEPVVAPPPPPQPSPVVEPARPEIAAPKAVAAPEPRPTISLSRNEIAAMLKRGQDLIAAGDIASARLILTHVAEAGDADASFILAGTYDPAVLATRRVVGVQPDPAKARAWYAKAAEQGSSEAKRRLDQSALR